MSNTELLNVISQWQDEKGAAIELDEDLRRKATALVNRYMDDLGHIDLRRVVFLKATGDSGKYLGKCTYVGKAEHRSVARSVLHTLASVGMVDAEELEDLPMSLVNLAYVITLNVGNLLAAAGAGDTYEMIEGVTLYHELLHIKEDMNGLVPHDTKDFSTVLDQFGVYWAEGAAIEGIDEQVRAEMLALLGGPAEHLE